MGTERKEADLRDYSGRTNTTWELTGCGDEGMSQKL